jgi:hypothetical protein
MHRFFLAHPFLFDEQFVEFVVEKFELDLMILLPTN